MLHGLEKQSGGGELFISSYLEGNRLVLEVCDNGVGVNNERLTYICSKLEEASKLAAEGISTDLKKEKDLFGLRNVVTRMIMYYGKESQFLFESDAKKGHPDHAPPTAGKCVSPLEEQAG